MPALNPRFTSAEGRRASQGIARAIALFWLVQGSGACADSTARAPINREPAKTLNEVSRLLAACWQPPPGSGTMVLTFQFGLTATGELRGRPRVTHSQGPGKSRVDPAVIEAAIDRLVACTPVAMTPELAPIAASRVLLLRLISSPRGRAMQRAAAERPTGSGAMDGAGTG